MIQFSTFLKKFTKNGFNSAKAVVLFVVMAIAVDETSAQPANDQCSGAITIPSCGPFPYLASTVANGTATTTNDRTPSCQSTYSRGIWYTLTPSISGTYTFSTCSNDAPGNGNFDNVTDVFTSSTNACGGTYTTVACNDDINTNAENCPAFANRSIVKSVNLTAGTKYFIQTSSYNTNSGNVALQVSGPCTTTPPQVPSVSNGGSVCNGSTSTLTASGLVPSGNSATLSGASQYYNTPNIYSATNFPNNRLTLEIWIKPAAAGVIVTERDNNGVNTSYHQSEIEILSSGKVKVNVWNSSGTATAISLGYASFNTWNHVVLRYNGTTLDGFLNGVKSPNSVALTRVCPFTPGAASGNCYYGIGTTETTNLGSGAYYNGQVDEFRIWNTNISDADIQAWMYKGLTSSHTNWANLIAYYKFDGNLNDSKNSYTLGAVNGPVVTGIPDILKYTWTGSAGAPSGSTATTQTTGALSANPSTFSVVASINNSTCTGGTASSNTSITVTSPPTVTSQPTNQTGCGDAAVSFSVNASGTNTYSWEWSTASPATWAALSTTPYGTTNYNTTTVTFNSPETNGWTGVWSVRCKVTSSTSGCVSYSNIVTITVNPAPVAPTLEAGPTVACSGCATNLTISAGSLGGPSNVATGLVAYYPFYNNLNDASGSGLNLTGTGTFSDGGVNLTGSTLTSASTSILNTDNHTIAFYMKYTTASDATWNHKIFSYAPAGTDRSPTIWKYNGANFHHWQYATAANGFTGYGDGSVTYNVGQWYYVVGVKNGANFTLYIDGVSYGTGTVANPKYAGSAPLVFGSADGVVLREFKIFNKSLSASEVGQLGQWKWYNATCGTGSIGSGPSINASPTTGAATIYARAESTCGITSCASRTYSFISAPSVTGFTAVCNGSSTGLTASGSGAQFYWYNVASGGSPIGFGSSFTTPAITSPASYWVETAYTPLSGVLNNFNSNFANVTSQITSPYAFTDGATGNNIVDGGNDMYDNGNYLNTNLTAQFNYSDNAVVSSAAFGTGGQYFTRKVNNMFIMGADLNNVTSFSITGNNGADGSGSQDSYSATITVGCQTYTYYVKRVWGAGDPSINHVVIVPGSGSGISQSIGATTDDDLQTVTGLNSINRLYYLLFASAGGAQVTAATITNIVTAFLNNAVGISTGCTARTQVNISIENTVPTISGCPSNISINTNAGTCTGTANWTVPTWTDNCMIPPTISGMTYLGTNGGNFYYQSTGTFTWANAKADAIAKGGNLAVIETAAENTFLTSAITTNCWIGFTDEVTEGAMKSVFGVPVVYNNWNAGEPNDAGGIEDYTEIYKCCGLDGKWNDNQGTVLEPYILEYGVFQTSGLGNGASNYPLGVTTNTYNAYDFAGNVSATCSFTVTVTDNIAPAITCGVSGTQNVNTGSGVCTYTHSGTSWNPSATSDNCSVATVTAALTGATTATGLTTLAGQVFNKGTTTVTWTVKDGANLTAACSFTVVVADNQAPVIATPGNQNINTTAGLCTGTYTISDPISDNCTGATWNYSSTGALHFLPLVSLTAQEVFRLHSIKGLLL